jgi:RecO N terminal
LQGFILGVKKIKSEDLLVTVLTERKIKKLYRFYGVRHSTINLGFKIDFAVEPAVNKNILRLKDVMHLGYPWLHDYGRLSVWQSFLALLGTHFYDTTDIEPFYYELLDSCADMFTRSNPKRLAVEAYVKLLSFEGRIGRHDFCFLCDRELEKSVVFGKNLFPAHPKCINGWEFETSLARRLLEDGKTIDFDDDELDKLYEIMLKGF